MRSRFLVNSLPQPRRLGLAMATALAAWCGLAAGPSRAGAIPNGSFEQPDGTKPSGWRTHTWRGSPRFAYAEIGHTGKRSVQISSTTGADAGWYIIVPVEPFTIYRLSGWIKTKDLQSGTGRGALFNLHNLQGVKTPAVTGTRDWTCVEVFFETQDQDSVQINCLFGGWGESTGTAWYDDVRLERISPQDWTPRITIEASRKGPPVSKYLYGQFIEHLGRCIYGGIWAEMLEDRKFYFPITAEYDPYRATRRQPKDAPFPVVGASPWQIIGPPDSVRMVTQDPFVGHHTPWIAPGSGIRQKDLGLIGGKDYVGYVWLKAAAGVPTVTVHLTGAEAVPIGRVEPRYRKYPLKFRATRSTDRGALEIRVAGGACFVGTVSLMPADNVKGMRADTLRLLKELGAPVYRWPGGNFVSGYDWRDGIGDRDRRPPRKNPAWTGVEHNDFGLDEFLTFCRLVDAEPYITVNSGLGDVEMAVQELEYANDPASSPMGRRRAANGHPEPYGVRFWAIGNEMYGRWQLGHMPLKEYVKKHNRFAEAMWAKDPSVVLVAVGAVGPWTEGMLRHCANHMDLISEHFYRGSQSGLIQHVRQMPEAVRRIAAAHRNYRRTIPSLKGKSIRIALDEWNYWYGPHLYGELGTRYFLRDALGVAAGLQEMVRNSDVYFMANYAQTVNVIGCIKTTKTAAAFETTGLVLKLYRHHFGTIPVAVESGGLLDVAAALTDAGRTLTIGVVNPTKRPFSVPLTVRGARSGQTATCWQIVGPDPLAYNAPGRPPQVTIQERNVRVNGTLPVPAYSVCLFALPLAKP